MVKILRDRFDQRTIISFLINRKDRNDKKKLIEIEFNRSRARDRTATVVFYAKKYNMGIDKPLFPLTEMIIYPSLIHNQL